MSDTTVTTQAPAAGNTTEARTPDGTLKDQGSSIPSQTPTPEADPEGQSFLTQKDKPEANKTLTEGEKKPEAEGDKKPEDKPAEGAPEKYADFKLPEGYELAPEAAKEITDLFKGMNLTQENAQKLVDYYGANLLKTAEAPYKQWADTQKEWVADIQDRFGSKADAVRRDINSAITNALPPSLARAFRTALDITGAGSNPEIFEALSILAKPHIEGKSIPSGKPSPEGQKSPDAPRAPTAAEAMYPHLVGNRQQ